jgi:hypothetical protein
MMFRTPKQIQADISIGVFLVWIGIIATAAGSFLYWGSTTMTFDSSYMDQQNVMTKLSLYGLLLLAFVIEAYKKAVLGTFQHRGMWYWLVFASVLTSVGGTMITNQTRQNVLTKSSDSYKDNKTALADAKTERSKYARCSSMSLDDLDARLTSNSTNVPRKANGKKDWTKFNSVKSKVAIDKQCLLDYQRADAAVVIAEADLTNSKGSGAGGAATSSDPLMYSIHEMIGTAENVLVMLFYILVTVLVEAVTYYIGGQVQRLKREKTLTANQIMVINVKENMGIDLLAIQDGIVENSLDNEMQYQLDEEKKKLMFDIKRQEMLNQIDVDRELVMANASNISGSSGVSYAGPVNNGDVDGFTRDELIARRDRYKVMALGDRLCPYCHGNVPVNTGTFYCNPSHQTEFNNVLRRLQRAS